MLSSHSRQELSAALAGTCNQAKLAIAIKDLLGLYWIAADSPEDRARQIALFVRDLAKFPEAVIAYAVHHWRTTQDRRPSIASLHQLCMARQHALAQRLDYLDGNAYRPAPHIGPEPTTAEIESRRAFVETTLAQAGFQKRTTGWVSPGIVAEEAISPKRVPHWSETASPDDPRWIALRQARAKAGVTFPEGVA